MSDLRKLAAGCFLLLAGNLISSAASADDMTAHRTEFDVRFGLLTIGKATFTIRFDSEQYQLAARGKTAGVAEMIAPGTGKADSAGRITENGLVAKTHSAVYFEKRKKKKSKLEMEFDEGTVQSVKLDPDDRKPKKGRKWVAIEPEQLRNVIDPASSILVPVEYDRANDPKAVCDRDLHVYDGDTRFDIALKYKATKTVATEGYDGFAFVCQLRYKPVSGHKRGQRNIEYMQENRDMEIWLAPMEGTNLFTPIRIEVPTWIGTFTAVPSYFGKAAD